MNKNVDQLYNLLPAIYRIRDTEEGWQLKALLSVIAEQRHDLEADIGQLYNNWFIETCQDWVIPYIGDLVGYQQIHEAGEPGDVTTLQGRQRNKIVISRRDVANTIRARRRKGTLSLLKDLSRDAAGWPYAYAVEFYKLLGITQAMNYRHIDRGRTVDIRDQVALEHVGGPFAREAHTVDVRRTISHWTPGRYNLPSLGLFVWRLKVYPVEMTEAYDVEEVTHGYTFSVLGNDTQLYTNPKSALGQTTPVNELNFPNPISRQAFKKHMDDYYGEGKSIQIWTIEVPARSGSEPHSTHGQHNDHGAQQHSLYGASQQHPGYQPHHGPQHIQYEPHLKRNQRVLTRQQEQQGQQHSMSIQVSSSAQQGLQSTSDTRQLRLIDLSRIVPADLSDWQYRPDPPSHGQPGKVAVDPVLGRIAFPAGHQPEQVLVSYCYAFSDDIGGGAYNRPILQQATTKLYQVRQLADPAEGPNPNSFASIREALNAWNRWKENNAGPYNLIIEIIDNGVYNEPLDIHLEENENLQIRAANRKRPIIRLVDWRANFPDPLKVSGEQGSRFTLDGLLITGRAVKIAGDIAEVSIRHCTLVPGWGLHRDCEPYRPTAPSLELFHVGQKVIIEHSILGAILVYQNEVREEPLRLSISDSILDAMHPEHDALVAPGRDFAYVVSTIARCTVLGRIRVHAIELAENSIFSSQIAVARRQWGCMRFCSLTPPELRVPRRYNCQPDLVEQVVDENKQLSAEEREHIKQRERKRVRPVFNSRRYGTPTYCQLALACPREITRGADDESEMGVFHELYQPQREANLRARLDDFTPAGMEAGIIYMT